MNNNDDDKKDNPSEKDVKAFLGDNVLPMPPMLPLNPTHPKEPPDYQRKAISDTNENEAELPREYLKPDDVPQIQLPPSLLLTDSPPKVTPVQKHAKKRYSFEKFWDKNIEPDMHKILTGGSPTKVEPVILTENLFDINRDKSKAPYSMNFGDLINLESNIEKLESDLDEDDEDVHEQTFPEPNVIEYSQPSLSSTENVRKRTSKKKIFLLLFCGVVVLTVSLSLGLSLRKEPLLISEEVTDAPAFHPTAPPTYSNDSLVIEDNETDDPTLPPTSFLDAALEIEAKLIALSGESVLYEGTPQFRAMKWAIYEDPIRSPAHSINLLQRYILMVIFYATSGTIWSRQEGWGSEEDECNWYGVRCKGGIVTKILITNNNMTGSIPMEITHLENLESLDLRNNILTGAIPSNIGNLTELSRFFLMDNFLTGIIPSSLENLSKLRVLRLKSNILTGTMPYNYAPGMVMLDLGDNSLTGTIPNQLGYMSSLQGLFLNENYFYGTMPSTIGNLTSLLTIMLYTVAVSGEIPSSFGQLTKIQFLYLDNTNLTGTVDESICNINISVFWTDCLSTPPEVECPCCTKCCIDGIDCYNASEFALR